MGVHVFTLATHASAGSRNMVAALAALGYDFSVLAEGQDFGGWLWRAEQYAAAAEQVAAAAEQQRNAALADEGAGPAEAQDAEQGEPPPPAPPPDEGWVVFVDAYDALPVRPPRGLEAALAAFGAALIVGAETGCAPLNCGRVDAWWGAHPEAAAAGTLARFVNGGFVAGRPRAVAAAYRWIVDQAFGDDQRGLTAFVDAAPPASVALDFDARLVQNLHVGEPLAGGCSIDAIAAAAAARRAGLAAGLDGGPPQGEPGSGGPFFVHFPGSRIKILLTPYNDIARALLGDEAERVRPHLARRDVELGVGVVVAVLLLAWLLRKLWRRRQAAATAH